MSDYLKIRQSNTDVILWWKRLVDKTYNISDKGKLLSLIESLK
jgi:hypothetical protein